MPKQADKAMHREWLEADVLSRPTRMLNGRAFIAARRAPRAVAKLVARSIWPPPDYSDGAGEWGTMLASFAVNP